MMRVTPRSLLILRARACGVFGVVSAQEAASMLALVLALAEVVLQ